jgi:hypothetical protein
MGQVFYHSVTRAPLDHIKTLNVASKVEEERVKVTNCQSFFKSFWKEKYLETSFQT